VDFDDWSSLSLQTRPLDSESRREGFTKSKRSLGVALNDALGGACFPATGIILSGGYPLRRGKKAALFRPRAISKMTRPEASNGISPSNVDAFIVENSDVSVAMSPNSPDQTGVYPHRGNRNIGAANDVADENKPARIDGGLENMSLN
jgi:hypothetical protein